MLKFSSAILSCIFILAASVICVNCDGKEESDLFKYCALWSSCDFADSRDGLRILCQKDYQSYKRRQVQGIYRLLWTAEDDCFRNAQTCEDLENCWYAPPELSGRCVGPLGWSFCSGNTLIHCSGDPDLRARYTDCGSAGLICREDDEFWANCGSQTCDPDRAGQYCDGDVRVHCSSLGNVLDEWDCKYFQDATCGTTIEHGTGCVGTGEECDPEESTSYCDGSVLVKCVGGKEVRVDCEKPVDTDICIEGTYGASCEYILTECYSDTPETCENGVVTFCFFGEVRKFDCRDFGFSGCAVEAGVKSDVAYCVR